MVRSFSLGDIRRGGILAVAAALLFGLSTRAAKAIVGDVQPLLLAGLLLPWVWIRSKSLIGFLGYGLSLVLFVLALREIGAARAGAYFSTAPFIGAVVGLVALRETLSIALIAAGLLMGFGVYLHLTEQKREAT